MEERVYLLTIKTVSSGTEERNLTPYDDANVALRKFHESFNVIGGGPTHIASAILDNDLNVLKAEVWDAAVNE